jgi:phage virion morphogenesis protein
MAADSLSHLNELFDGLIEALSPQARKQLAKQIAATLRKSQAQRIKANKNPDGSAYTPRKPQPGHIKRKLMFQKLVRTKWLKQKATSEGATIGFVNNQFRHPRLLEEHQYGLRLRLKGYIEIQYPKRELLGFTKEELAAVEELLLDSIQTSSKVK